MLGKSWAYRIVIYSLVLYQAIFRNQPSKLAVVPVTQGEAKKPMLFLITESIEKPIPLLYKKA